MEIRTREQYISYIRRTSTIPKGFDGSTPIKLIEEMVNKLPVDWSNPNLKILDPGFGFGGYLFFVYLKLIQFHSEEHILNNMLYGVEIEDFRFELVKHKLKIKNLIKGDFLDNKIFKNMKFDVIVGNPPYQEKVGPNKNESIWNKFVKKSFNFLKEDGYSCVVHPGTWRAVYGNFIEIKKLLTDREIIYLNMNSTGVGKDTFGVNTAFDFYVVRNKKSNYDFLTKVNDYNGNKTSINLFKRNFIPNSNLEYVYSLVAKDNEDTVEILSDSTYHTQRSHMNSKNIGEFKYPCVYTVGSNNPNFWYSNNKGIHFGIPKVIWGNGLTDVIIDRDGEYGLTQFAYAILDDVENLDNIYKALKSEKFIKEIMGYESGVGHIYDRKLISSFRKDFWKEFIND